MSFTLIGVTLGIFILLTAIATALFRDVLSAIIVFGAYSLGMALLYTYLLAPDVALTEAAIGAGVTTILLILTISRTVRPRTDRPIEAIDWPAALVSAAFVVVLSWTVLGLEPVGSTASIAWANEQVTHYYLANAYAETGVENAVTAVLAAYRGFDTFGEAVVVFTVGVAVMVALDREVLS
ncbi:MAG: DUF4040 domain-containing protein [Halobacteriota archaeon]